MINQKITAPGLPAGIVQRERLFRLLEKSSKPVVWISGPGGSGKTTLVSSYLAARKLPAIWYHVDQSDADPATFFYYMGLALGDAASADQPLPLLTPEYLVGVKTFTRRYFEQLFSLLPVPCAVVLDNYQDVSSSSPFHELIMEGLSFIPDGITVIALSRNEPPPVLTTHESAKRFQFVGWGELRFSFDEAREFTVQTESHLETEALTRLYTKTDGWIAGLLLILESRKGSDLDYQLLEKMPLDKVFGYFADKIFDGSDAELQQFLLKTALVPGITAQMAESLTGIGSSEQILSRLCRNRFFTGKNSPGSEYQYHPLFREFLLSRGEKAFPADELREVRRKAASLLEAVGRTEDAAGLLKEAADWDGITELVLNSAPVFASEGRIETVRALLEGIPAQVTEMVPGLLYWKGICLLLHAPSQSRSCFRKAFDLFSQAKERVGMLLSWCGGAEVSLYDGEFSPLDDWLSLLEGMQLDDVAFPSPQLECQVAMSIYNTMAFRQPQHPEIDKWRERGAPIVRGAADINIRLQAAIQLVVHDLWRGNFDRATFMLEQAQGMARESRRTSPMTDITISNGQILHALYTGALASGVATAIDAVRMADETGVHILDRQVLGNGAACALYLGDLAAADDLLKRMESSLRDGWGWKNFDIGYFHLLRGWQKSHRNDFAAASQHLELSLDGVQAAGFVAAEALVHDLVAFNAREMGERDRAAASLSRAYQFAYAMKSGLLEFFCLCNSVDLALDASREPEAIALLRKAMTLGSRGGYAGCWFWRRPSSLLRLCVKALENDIEVDYVTGLIRRWSLVPEEPPLHLDTWPWPLKINALGAFQVIQDDEPGPLAGKVKKPFELLKALIALGGKNVAQESLSDALWPDADGDLAQRSFDTTLHRLRKMLGNEKVLKLQAGRLSLDPRHSWVDTWAFERRCVEVDEALKVQGQQNDTERLALCFEKAAVLYKGRFLAEDADQAWAVPMREQMRTRFLQLINKMGTFYETLQQWDRAAAAYKLGLEVDALAEEFQQRLLVCCRQQ